MQAPLPFQPDFPFVVLAMRAAAMAAGVRNQPLFVAGAARRQQLRRHGAAAMQEGLQGAGAFRGAVLRVSDSMGWEAMAASVSVRCFTHDPTIKSSLKFLRRTPWAREKAEQLYLQHVRSLADNTDEQCRQ